MPTRQFVLLIATLAMVAVGVGLVVGSRTAPDAIHTRANEVTRETGTAPHEEDIGAPATNSVSTANAPSAPRAAAGASADGARGGAAKRAPAAAADTAETTKAPSPDSINRADVALPLQAPTVPERLSSASDSEFVFVSRSALLKGKLAANEAAAIATLRSVSSAQAQLQSAGVIDTDADGAGEYGYFGELAGTAACRVPPGEERFKLEPALFNAALGKVTPTGNMLRNGYFFRMYLPGSTAGRKIAGIPEASGGGAALSGAKPDHDNCEIYYSCYAWPADFGKSGTRAFFINQEGDMLFLANTSGTYNGEAHAPAFDAALSAPRSLDMAAPVVEGAKCNDGQAWVWYQGPEPRIPSYVELGPATKADAEKGNSPDGEKVVVPRSMIHRAQMTENESAAIMTLSVITKAQLTLQSMHSIDTDNDGAGEYGFLGELAGTSPCRAAAGGKRALLRPAVLSSTMGRISNAGNLVKDGYVYRMYLPGATSNGKVPALAEAAGGGCVTVGARPNADNAEILWITYAWPLEAGQTGQCAFFTNSEGEFMFLGNSDGFYSGEERSPPFDAALDATNPGDMKSRPAVDTKSVDGRTWKSLF